MGICFSLEAKKVSPEYSIILLIFLFSVHGLRHSHWRVTRKFRLVSGFFRNLLMRGGNIKDYSLEHRLRAEVKRQNFI